jgi:hypothetical protein
MNDEPESRRMKDEGGRLKSSFILHPSSLSEAPPPILGSWRNIYLLVLGALVVDILLLRLFTRLFS